MTYFWQCDKCLAQTMIETDDEKMAQKSLKRFQKKHNCKCKRKANEPIQQIQHRS